MKKTTKFLLVLAAVVAMTIGAVSTVMAADYPVIATWGDDDVTGYTADGTKITRGWAVSKDSGIYYYFVNGKIAKNTFVKTGSEVYFLGSEGAMHSGWLEVKADDKFTFNDATNVTLDTAFPGDVLVGSANTMIFTADTPYKTVWMYFNANGELLTNEWEEVKGAWYYLDGPFCVMNDWGFKCAYDENGKLLAANKQKTYGFNESGAMMAGWAAYSKVTDTTANSGKPYEKPGESKDVRWTYYSQSGVKAKEGWLKDDAGDWFFMIADDKVGVKCLTNAFISIDGATFYLDNAGRMVKGAKALSGANNGNTTYVFYDVTYLVDGEGNTVYTLTDSTATKGITVEKKKTDYFLFDSANGKMLTGIQGTAFYQNADDMATAAYKVTVSANASGTAIDVNATGFNRSYPETGKMMTDTFLYVKSATEVYYFYQGVMVKNDAVAFGDVADGYILAFGSDGKLVMKASNEAVKIGDASYYKGDILLPGTTIPCSKIK
ncbi:MAG: hypothetical protein IJW18_05745 [Lachnospiraceae bacterium]|nr:hypothetical protein [Lachnospiraceae bacterium]